MKTTEQQQPEKSRDTIKKSKTVLGVADVYEEKDEHDVYSDLYARIQGRLEFLWNQLTDHWNQYMVNSGAVISTYLKGDVSLDPESGVISFIMRKIHVGADESVLASLEDTATIDDLLEVKHLNDEYFKGVFLDMMDRLETGLKDSKLGSLVSLDDRLNEDVKCRDEDSNIFEDKTYKSAKGE